MSLRSYIVSRVKEWHKEKEKNKGEKMTNVEDKAVIIANAKAEQIVDDLVILYNSIFLSNPREALLIKSALRNTLYVYALKNKKPSHA